MKRITATTAISSFILLITACTSLNETMVADSASLESIHSILYIAIDDNGDILNTFTDFNNQQVLNSMIIKLSRIDRFKIYERTAIGEEITNLSQLFGFDQDKYDCIFVQQTAFYPGPFGLDLSLSVTCYDQEGNRLFSTIARSDHEVVLIGTVGEGINAVTNRVVAAIKAYF